jgi:outer membrane protein assembly factor BamA
MRLFFICVMILFCTAGECSANKLIATKIPNLSLDTIPLQVADTVKSKNYIVVNNFIFIGNKTTKRHIIARELTFKKGDTLRFTKLAGELKSSKENVLNTSLFNFVTIDTIAAFQHYKDVVIKVAERWYIWPAPIFEIAERNFNTWWETRNFKRANYGITINWDNFRGSKEKVALILRFGYNERYGLSYTIPYIDAKQRSGLGFSFNYSRNHEIAYATLNNKVLFYKDRACAVRQELYAKVSYTYRKEIHTQQTLELRYSKGFITDSVLKHNENYFTTNTTTAEFLSLNYYLYRDYRDSRAYPLKGRFFDVDVNKSGLGILAHEKIDMLYITSSLRGYWKLSDRFFASGSIRAKVSSRINQPYYLQRGLGYGEDYVRGYEYYAIDGQHFWLNKAAIKYELVKPRIQYIRFIPAQKFNTIPYAIYANIFIDHGYVYDKLYYLNNTLANKYLFGAGLGVDLVTYYDAVIRFEYAINKLKEYGFYLHFNSPF